MTRSVSTVCPYCGVGCGMFLIVRDGRVVGVQPDVAHPASGGKLCSKGWNAYQFVHQADRLTVPMIRKDGLLRAASWGEAVELMARRSKEIIEGSGGDSIAVIASAKGTNEENYLIQKFARAVIGTNNVDHCARLCHAPSLAALNAAFGSGAMTNSISDLEEAECIFVVGSDTTSQHPLIAARMVAAKEKGAKLIVADPRRTRLAAIADIHIQHRPGSDVALLLGMMRVIVDNSLENKMFIEERTEGLEELLAALDQFPLQRASELTGLPVAIFAEAALTYARSKRSAVAYAMGITQHTSGTENVLALANLVLLTGSIGQAGTGLNPLRGQNNVQGACDMGAIPDVFPGYQEVSNPAVRDLFASAWGVSQLPTSPGLTEPEMLEAAVAGKVRAMYVVGENPVLSHPDAYGVKEALTALDFMVVQDIFLTETAELAHVVLPAACWAEKDGTFTSTERRVQRIRKGVEPPGESRPDWEIIGEVARAMGSGNLFPFESAQDIFEELRRLIPSYGGMRWEDLVRGSGIQWPCLNEGDPGTPILHSERFPRGRAKFHAVQYRQPTEMNDQEYPYLLTTGRVETQWLTGSMTRRSPSLNDESPEAYMEINPQDALGLRLADGEEVGVRSRRGRIRLKIHITETIMQGLVFIPFHFAEAAANILTSPALDPVAKIPSLKVCAVSIEKSKQPYGERSG